MADKMNLMDLPTEIILLILEALDNFSDLLTSRFVCQRLAATSKRLLYPELNVCLTTKSLERLRYISADSLMARSVKTLKFDLSLYNTESSTDDDAYETMCTNEVRYMLEEAKREWKSDQSISDLDRNGLRVFGEKLVNEFEGDFRTPEGKTLIQAFWLKYRNLHDDQQAAIQEFADISGFADILRSFTNLRYVDITDKSVKSNWNFMKNKSVLVNGVIGDAVRDLHWDEIEFWESSLHMCMDSLVMGLEEDVTYPITLCNVIASTCLCPGKWREDQEDWEDRRRPSVTFLGDIFTALAESSTFPKVLRLNIVRYEYLNIYKMTDAQLEDARHVLQKVETIDAVVTPCPRKPNNQPTPFTLDDWRQLKKLIAVLCDNHPKLERLGLFLDGYLDLNGGALLPSDNEPFDLRWNNSLDTLFLHGLVLLHTEFEHMVRHLPQSLEELWFGGFGLHSGSWTRAIDFLRNSLKSRRVEELTFRSPYGAEYGIYDYPPTYDSTRIENYILGRARSY